MNLLSGTKSNIVVIADGPTNLSSEIAIFEVVEPAKVVGQLASVCFSLKGDVTTKSQVEMQSVFDSLLGDAVITVNAHTKDGDSIYLPNQSQSWSLYGKIEDSSELSACMSIKRGDEIPKETNFVKFEIGATKPLEIRGIYWESSNAWDDN